MHSKLLVLLGLCFIVSIVKIANATPPRQLGSQTDSNYYGYPNKYTHPRQYHHDKYPFESCSRPENVKANVTRSLDCDYGRDDYDHKSCAYDEYDYKGYGVDGDDPKVYGDCYGYKGKDSDGDDYGDDNYGHENDNSSFDKSVYSHGYGRNYEFYDNDFAMCSGCGNPVDGYYPGSGSSYLGFVFLSHFGYESTADGGGKDFDPKTEEGVSLEATT